MEFSAIVFFPLILLVCVFTWRFARYVSTPVLKKLGYYKYYSPMFMTMRSFGKRLDFHLGTSFDFFLQKHINQRKIFLYMAEGLVKLAEDINSGSIRPDTRLYGNTFYLKRESLVRFGFSVRKMNNFESVLFALNYLELCLLKSISSGKPSLIPVNKVWIIEISASDLVKNCGYYQKLYSHLSEKETEQDSQFRYPLKK